jgi:hypothetical protein
VRQRVPAVLLFALMLSGCVQTRMPQPVVIKQITDAALTCQTIANEYKTNTEVALSKISKNNSSDVEDILVAIFIWPGLVDGQNADGMEGNALLDRNIYLRKIARDKNCPGMETWPPQPERYSHRFNSPWSLAIDAHT